MGKTGSWATALAASLITACSATSDPVGNEETGSSESAAPASSDTATPADDTAAPPTTDATSSPPAGSSDGSTAGSDSGTGEPGTGESGVVRFVAFGDTGEGNEAQHMVANAAELVCARQGCDFAMLLGDNFYDVGVTAVDDPQFATKFEQVYDGLDMPFYIVLGNHDYGTLASDWERGQYQIDYGLVNPKWVMPHFWYTFSSESGDTQFFALDTQRLMFDYQTDAQTEWYDEQLAASSSAWKVVMAHHPYISNGEHGNAGNYEGLSALPLIAGKVIKDFVDARVCENSDVYLSGHDHNRQAFDPVCGTYFIVSGASAKTTEFAFRDDNPTEWGDDQREGFVWVEIAGNDFRAQFYDLDGNMDHEQAFSK
jgi:tartrate-resistant acid phosphatase type 5